MKKAFLFVCAFSVSVLLFSCKKEIEDKGQPASPVVVQLNCEEFSGPSELYSGIGFSDTLFLPYRGGNGAIYPEGDTLQAADGSGLFAKIIAGKLSDGDGRLPIAVWGIPEGIGIKEFSITFLGKSCRFSLLAGDPDTLVYGQPFQELPERQDAVIYQVNMRVFSPQGNFQGVEERLDSIKKLGTSVLYLMPVFPIGVFKGINSPYCVRSYRKINPEFGDMPQLRRLVEAAHQRGMAVMLDWVANHTAWDHEWMSSHPEWYLRDGNGNVLIPPGTNWQDVAQLNFTNMEMRREMIRSMKYWIYQANIDGFRCDYADGPPFDFWRQAIDSLRKMPNRKLLLLAEGSRNNHFIAGFDFTFGFNFFNTLKSIYRSNASATNLNGLNFSEFSASSAGQQVVRYTSNHDVNGSDGTPLELFGGLEGSVAAFAIASLLKGIPMIYGGQEVGTPYRLFFPFTGANITWSLNPGLSETYRKILALRKVSKAVRLAEPLMHSNTDVVFFSKEWQGEKVLVLVNVRNSEKSIDLPAGFANQTWTDVLNGSAVSTSNALSLGPYSCLILQNP